MADHLNGSAKAEACLGYSEWLSVQKDEQHVPKKQRRLDETMVIRISEERRERIDKELAQCLFQSGKPLSLFEHNCWKDFFKQNFGYTLPSRFKISRPLLDECYDSTKQDVSQELSSSSSLSLVIDESTNISKNRIINTSVVLPSSKSFYWSNIEANVGKMGAEELTDHIIKTAKDITNTQLSKIVSITTDTCSTMEALRRILKKTLGLEHILTIPCDSHGLQLLIKDILQRPSINQT